MATITKSALRVEFLEYLFGEQRGTLCIATADKYKAKFKQVFYDWPGQKPELAAYLASKVENHNIWFCVNLLSQAERKKANCMPTSHIWADLDFVDYQTIDLPPSCVIETSPNRYQAFWRVEEPIPSDLAEEYSKRITYSVGADRSGWDLTQLMRLPYTTNFKYAELPEVVILTAHDIYVPLDAFEELPEVASEGTEQQHLIGTGDMPDVDSLPDPNGVVYNYRGALKQTIDFASLYAVEPKPGADWSRLLWRLINLCVESEMSREEVFAIALSAKCNKYARDKRPVTYLWREVKKAFINHSRITAFASSSLTKLEVPQLVDPDSLEEDSFLVDYKKWGEAATDAPSEYHELACFVALSAITSAGLKLDTSHGELIPNLWGLILGESTLTRKTTAMRMAMDIVNDILPEAIVATDGSAEGLLSGLSLRPKRVSIFYKDEVSGFFDSINRKDYLAGLPETLTQLYDVPKVLQRLLRKEKITITEPYFIFFGGGVRDKVYSLVTEEYVLSGFIPRFLIVSGENDLDRVRRTGPPTRDTWDLRQNVISTLGELKVRYNLNAVINVGGKEMEVPSRIEAKLTDDAWNLYGDIEMKLIHSAASSGYSMIALPTFQRLAFSMLKMSMLIAASRREVKDNNILIVEKSDIIQASWYIQRWGRHTVDLISNAGKPQIEKLIDKVVLMIRDNPGILRSDLMTKFHLSSKEMRELMNTLLERGVIDVKKQGNGLRFFTVVP